MQVVQAGRGAVRPLVVAYHVIANLRPHVSADTAILSYVGKPFSQSYAAFSGASPDLDAIATRYAAELGAEAFWPILLLGFSEGCQGIRTQLRAGFSPSAILAIDGIHSNLPPAPWQLEVWRDWFARSGADLAAGPQEHCPAVDGAPIAVVTFSQIPTEQARNPYTSTRHTMEAVTGWELPPGPSPDDPAVSCSGNVWLYSFPGMGEQTHIHQGQVVLPNALEGLATSLGFGPGGATPPLPPSSPVGPPATPGASDGVASGAAVLVALALGGATYLAIRRRNDNSIL